MRIIALSDTHNRHARLDIPDGDVVVHAGDFTNMGTIGEVTDFLAWYSGLLHPHKVLIAGNHDLLFENEPALAYSLLRDHPGITYLQDAGVEIRGLLFWGSPWQPRFGSWAFNLDHDGLVRRWARIPDEAAVVVTHGPPHGILDLTTRGPRAGCTALRERLRDIGPKLHICGHIHEAVGRYQACREDGSMSTLHVNASIGCRTELGDVQVIDL
jgi:predicted phosphohydrolase